MASVNSRNDLLSVLSYELHELFPITGFDINFDRIIHSDQPVLLDEGLCIGNLILHLPPGSNYVGDDLLKSVSAQVSAAISRIWSTEEVANREGEKTLLLTFSNEIAAIKNRADLFDEVVAKVKKIFGIERFIIAKINEDQTTFSAFALDPSGNAIMQPDYKNLASGNHQINDGVFSRAIASDDPVLFDVHNLSQEPGAPAYVDFWKRVGMQYVMIVALRAGGNNIGFAILNFNTCERIDTTSTLLKGICVQLAVKVSQILAYEEIERREREKSMLLAFSNAIASERNKNAFAKILKQQLNELFQIQDYVIHALSEDKKYQTPLLFDPDADFANHPDFSKLVGHWTDIRDGVFDVALTSPGPVTINIEQTVVALRLGHEVIGVMKFRHEDQTEFVIQERLFKSICSQIAISAANIIANEKVNQQLNEIKKYKEHLEEEKIYLKEEIESSINNSEIVGESPELKKVFRLIAQVAYSDSTVLLLGETGTGKELVARAIHNSSPHKSKLMVKVNCAAIPPTLIESELFGHERGSFTGAVERRIGKFELANNGTLFLDEIGEMTLEVQVKLLRALQEREIERVGGKAAIKTNVRIITATNRDLEKLLEEGKFRSDLYYRLNTFPITIPPLRNRKDDIPKLAMHFIARYSKKTGKKIEAISHKVIQELIEYDWPGNIRELEHLIERSVLMVTGDSINEVHLPHQKRNTALSHDKEDNIIKSLKENEKDHILKVLRHVKGRIGGKGGAAEILGLPTSTLNSRIKKLGIRREHL